ncbi:hypothetical protein T4E_6400 [Trichinella pseudospiralis]|uniref:Uncharacterized protein n=3 Tax=Trichinella pseudospiralis TaxID=6337 RepID=A0A0V0YN49_TRIPS|nr:hypothetical protein T4E_6400 [Trichinella pseudospiralis]
MSFYQRKEQTAFIAYLCRLFQGCNFVDLETMLCDHLRRSRVTGFVFKEVIVIPRRFRKRPYRPKLHFNTLMKFVLSVVIHHFQMFISCQSNTQAKTYAGSVGQHIRTNSKMTNQFDGRIHMCTNSKTLLYVDHAERLDMLNAFAELNKSL